MASHVLSSWKEIANYFGKGVRTVQRWESELGLPVHRPVAANKGIVMAFPSELDHWAKRNLFVEHNETSATLIRVRPSEQTTKSSENLLQRALRLQELVASLNERTKLAMDLMQR